MLPRRREGKRPKGRRPNAGDPRQGRRKDRAAPQSDITLTTRVLLPLVRPLPPSMRKHAQASAATCESRASVPVLAWMAAQSSSSRRARRGIQRYTGGCPREFGDALWVQATIPHREAKKASVRAAEAVGQGWIAAQWVALSSRGRFDICPRSATGTPRGCYPAKAAVIERRIRRRVQRYYSAGQSGDDR